MFRRILYGRIKADPYWSSVSRLFHFDGTNGSTTFTDSGPLATDATVSAGSPTISTGQSKFGGSSLLNGVLTMGSGASLGFGTGAFTLECFIRGNNDLVATGSGAGQYEWLVNPGNSHLQVWISNVAKVTGSATLSASTWSHVVWQRDGSGNNYIFVDGVQDGSFSDSTDLGSSPTTFIGAYQAGGGDTLSGNLDELRITKGVARYSTSGFTAPTAPFSP